MTKTLAFLAAALAFAAPLRAQEFFGLDSSDVQAMVAKARAEEHAEFLRRMGQTGSSLAPVGRAVGLLKTLDSRRDCILDAVLQRKRIVPFGDIQWPDVLLGSETDEARYAAAVKAANPSAPEPRSFATIYLQGYNVIYLADSASAYPEGATMDAALAGEYARWVDYALQGLRDRPALDADAAQTRAWYASAYPAGRSSCAR